jgi:type-F conjugative transfer system pilin assembly protein TrbC
MPICSRSTHNRAHGYLMLLAAFSPALAQDSRTPSNARSSAQHQGDAALDRVKTAISAREAEAEVQGPSTVPVLPEEQRRRAFEGLRRRVASPAMEDRARAALDKGKEALSVQREQMAKRLGQALGLDPPDAQAIAGIVAPSSAKGWVPVLFVSSSMPLAVLRTYAVQLEYAGGVLAFRGMPGGLSKVGPMARLSAQVLRLDPGCEGPACAMRNVQLIVDPLVFRAHNVVRVPALAMVPGDPTEPYCERDDDLPAPTSSHVVYGDAALSGLLEEYARLGGSKEVAHAQARLEGR